MNTGDSASITEPFGKFEFVNNKFENTSLY